MSRGCCFVRTLLNRSAGGRNRAAAPNARIEPLATTTQSVRTSLPSRDPDSTPNCLARSRQPSLGSAHAKAASRPFARSTASALRHGVLATSLDQNQCLFSPARWNGNLLAMLVAATEPGGGLLLPESEIEARRRESPAAAVCVGASHPKLTEEVPHNETQPRAFGAASSKRPARRGTDDQTHSNPPGNPPSCRKPRGLVRPCSTAAAPDHDFVPFCSHQLRFARINCENSQGQAEAQVTALPTLGSIARRSNPSSVSVAAAPNRSCDPSCGTPSARTA